jgi:PAS domain S-box-containing protein
VKRSAARAFVLLGVLAIGAHVLLGPSDNAVYDAIGIASTATILGAVALFRPANRAGWLLLAGSMALFAAGDVAYAFQSDVYPNAADVFYLVGYVGWLAALGSLVRHERLGRDIGTVIDALVVVGCVGLALWSLFVDEQMDTSSLLAQSVSLAYPIGDLLLLAVLLYVLFQPARRTPAFWWLFAGVAVMPLADTAYVVPSIDDATYGIWMDVLWLASYIACVTAVLHPSRESLTIRSQRDHDARVTIRRVYVLGLAVLSVPVAAVVTELWRGFVDTTVVAAASIALVCAVTFRVALILRELYEVRDRLIESERRFRMVFERSPIGISVGRDGMMSETNPALQRLLGYTQEELARTHYAEVTHPDDRTLDLQMQLDAGTRNAFSVDKRYVAKDGRAVEAHVHIALDADDGLGISLVEDVTNRRALEEQLRQSQKMEAIGQLAGGVAHDFNNLMTAVLGYGDLVLARLDPDDPNRGKIEAICDAATRASDLTRQLLAFGRRQMLQTADVDLRGVVERMDGLLRRLIGEHIELVTVYGSEPVVVRADPVQIEQVVVNLAVNARDAMPEGGTLTIAALEDGADAILSVADTGTGMDEETQAHIFEPFFTTKPIGAGTGLGLSTVDGIVGQSGGTLELVSERGTGTLFTIRLPLHLPALALPEPEPVATLVD